MIRMFLFLSLMVPILGQKQPDWYGQSSQMPKNQAEFENCLYQSGCLLNPILPGFIMVSAVNAQPCETVTSYL